MKSFSCNGSYIVEVQKCIRWQCWTCCSEMLLDDCSEDLSRTEFASGGARNWMDHQIILPFELLWNNRLLRIRDQGSLGCSSCSFQHVDFGAEASSTLRIFKLMREFCVGSVSASLICKNTMSWQWLAWIAEHSPEKFLNRISLGKYGMGRALELWSCFSEVSLNSHGSLSAGAVYSL